VIPVIQQGAPRVHHGGAIAVAIGLINTNGYQQLVADPGPLQGGSDVSSATGRDELDFGDAAQNRQIRNAPSEAPRQPADHSGTDGASALFFIYNGASNAC